MIEANSPKIRESLTRDQIIQQSKDHSYFTWSVQETVAPLVIDKAQGIYVWDMDGTRYTDLTSQLVLSNIGHSHPHVIKRMHDQMEKVCFVSPAHTTEVRAKVSKKLAEIAPGNLCKTYFTLGGADSNENAIKMAQIYSGKKKVLSRYRSYHGATYVASNAGGDPRKHHICENVPWTSHFHVADTDSPTFKNLTAQQADDLSFELLERTLLYENVETVAAIILEGYSGSSGIYNPGKRYWQKVRKLCTDNNILLIADEVMSGFGRTGKWFAVNHYDITPDIITIAKGMTSGYAPLGGVITTKEISNYFDKNMFQCGMTYSSHPLSLAACLGTLEVYEDEKLIEQAALKGEYLLSKLEGLQEKHSIIREIRGTGLHLVIDLQAKDGTPLTPWNKPANEKMKGIVSKMRANGLLGLTRWNWVFVTPPLTITTSEIDQIIDLLDDSLK
jgi:taurine---2-oxoglutarate transaminase